MTGAFLEVVLNAEDLSESGIEGRDEIEGPLEAALEESGAGEITGGGGGSGVVVLDVEFWDEGRFDEGLAVLTASLRALKVPASTIVRRRAGEQHAVYE